MVSVPIHFNCIHSVAAQRILSNIEKRLWNFFEKEKNGQYPDRQHERIHTGTNTLIKLRRRLERTWRKEIPKGRNSMHLPRTPIDSQYLAIFVASQKKNGGSCFLPSSLHDPSPYWKTHRYGNVITVLSEVPILTKSWNGVFSPQYSACWFTQMHAVTNKRRMTFSGPSVAFRFL